MSAAPAKKPYDLIAIGSGVAAQVASARVRAAGWSVAIVDHRPFGGTCALRGCDPKKVLVGGAESVDMARRMRGRGVVGEPRIDWPELVAFKRTFTDPVPQERESEFAESGIDALHGVARFTGPGSLEVDGQALEARHFLIASGARPVPLRFPGEQHVATSDQFLELARLPPRIAMVGGGYIASEFSHIAARAGARVTVLQRRDRLLPQFDPDLVSFLMEKFRELGIDVRTGSAVEGVEPLGEGFRVHVRSGDAVAAIEADLVVHAAGRMPDLEHLDLAAAEVATENGRLRLNEFLQSASNPRVYAANDAAGKGPPLTPVASHEARIVAMKRVREQGFKLRVNFERAQDWYTARRVGETVYGYKTLIEEGSRRILGAHLIGPHAEEVINLFGVAIRHDLDANDLETTMFAYPTAASDITYML